MKNTFSHQKTSQRKANETEQRPSAGPGGMALVPHQNRTGLPDALKTGVEGFSGMALDDVRVHYNSSKPAQLQALAYTQGTDIHVAPGQERHLPHEAWHVVQQAQGRVQPTMQMKGGVPVNDDKGLEHEADVMGRKSFQSKPMGSSLIDHPVQVAEPTVQRMPTKGDAPKKKGWQKQTKAPTGRYKNKTGHHDPTIDKSRKKAVKKGYTGKRGKKPKGG